MERLPAKVLEPPDVRRLLRHVREQRYPERNTVLVQLSFKAGLRACEMAGLEWPMLLTSNRQIGQLLTISNAIAKKGSGRKIPVHPDLAAALSILHRAREGPTAGPVILSQRGSHMTPAAIVNWFRNVYDELGLHGCSSHSGRRTFITRSARLLTKTGGSLRDIQELAGHRALTTTERYIEGDRASQRRLINLL